MKKLFTILLIWASVTESGFAGAWASGGGELYRDGSNPWFLHNTRKVTYCVLVDEMNFGVNKTTAERITRLAIEYWKHEFSNAVTPDSEISIATQDFELGECNATTDLRVQLGVLTDIQMDQFALIEKRPQQFVGLAIRTEYDEVNLKGKGFVYISPESGILRFEGQSLMNHPWSLADLPDYLPNKDHGILHKVLVHELGHVFGVQHTPSPYTLDSFDTSVMDPEYPELLVSEKTDRNIEFAWDLKWIPGYFSSKLEYLSRLQNPSDIAIEFLGYRGPNASEFFFKNTDTAIEVFADGSPDDIPVGRINKSSLKKSDTYFPVVLIKLNPDQRVFSNRKDRETIFGPGFSLVSAEGVYESFGANLKRQIYFRHNPLTKSFILGGVMDGKLISDLSN